ncbi:hypothetical protein [Dendrosporobacter sp. 1207_IL3150]|uniref:hypothetical protein n=1 Tax=Dendrosporobacter sp. 1207_IL3150 TaxID=3084054 RepID=UPI002FDA66B8
MSKAIEAFENWYETMSQAEKDNLDKHLLNKFLLTEGVFAGPTMRKNAGLNAGPVSSLRVCPSCGRPI